MLLSKNNSFVMDSEKSSNEKDDWEEQVHELVKSGAKSKVGYNLVNSIKKSKLAINRDLMRIERNTFSPAHHRSGRTSLNFAKHVSSYTKLSTYKNFKSSSAVMTKPGSTNSKVTPSGKKVNVSAYITVNTNQMILENLQHETESQ